MNMPDLRLKKPKTRLKYLVGEIEETILEISRFANSDDDDPKSIDAHKRHMIIVSHKLDCALLSIGVFLRDDNDQQR